MVTPCLGRFCEPTPPPTPHLAAAGHHHHRNEASSAALRYAIVTVVCNSSSSSVAAAAAQVSRAVRLRRVLHRLGVTLDTVAVSHGIDEFSLGNLRRAGWLVHDVSNSVDVTRIMRPIGSLAAGKAGKHWPRVLRRTNIPVPSRYDAAIARAHDIFSLKAAQKNVTASLGVPKNYLGKQSFSSWAKFWELPRHTDEGAHACATLPLLAWNLTAYDRLLVIAADRACPEEDPAPWMRQHADAYLIGATDRADAFDSMATAGAGEQQQDALARTPKRAWDGIDDRLLYLQPDAQVYDLLMESARTGSYIPFGGSSRDVIETLFPTHLAFPRLPQHSRKACLPPWANKLAAIGNMGAGASLSSSSSLGGATFATGAQASSGNTTILRELSLPPPRPSNSQLTALSQRGNKWWMLYRGEVAPKAAWPRHSMARAPTPRGCLDANASWCHSRALGTGCGDPSVASACGLSCGTCTALRSRRFALVVFICNGGNDHYGNPPTEQIVRALRLRRSLARLQSQIATVAVVHGYDAESVGMLRAVGWEVRDISHVNAGAIMRQIPRETAGYHWPRYRKVQERKDNMCRAVHLLAWNLTEFDRIILSDLDLCMSEDPLPWLRRHSASHFVAFNEMAKMRGFRGINCHLALLHPSEIMGRLVLDKARTASYVPYTRGAQDVIETIFATQVQFDDWPAHVHATLGKVDYKLCDKKSTAKLQRQPGGAGTASLAAFNKVNERMLAEERVLVSRLAARTRSFIPAASPTH